MTLRSYPTQCPWHTDTLIILLYFMTVSMHMIINVTTSDLCFLVFSATTTLPGYYYYNDDGSNYYVYHWEWWTLNFELWPGETWTVKGETLSSHVISVIQLGWQLWSLDSKNRQNKIIWDFVIYKTEGINTLQILIINHFDLH